MQGLAYYLPKDGSLSKEAEAVGINTGIQMPIQEIKMASIDH